MADERYEWLDKDAAERLLRGEPVDPVDGPSGTDAGRLAAALEAAARAARPATTELPGEAAALAAFRETPRAARARGAAGRADGPAARAEVLAPVHLGRGPGAGAGRGRRTRWSRPVRFGLVASFAGCALGGVAVAAGTGILPVPFGGGAQPASSVSAAASPKELGSSPSDGRTVPPPASPGTGATTSPATPSAPADGQKSGGPRRTKDPDGGGGGGTASGGGNGRRPGAPTGSVDGRHGGGSGSGAGWYAKAVQACRDYRDGSLNEQRRRKLEELAKGAANLDRFCDRVLEESGNGQNGNGQGGSGGGSDNNQGSDRGTGDDHDEDENEGRGNGSGIGYTATPSPAGNPGGEEPPGAPAAPSVRGV